MAASDFHKSMTNGEKGEGRGGNTDSNKNKFKTGSGSEKDSNNTNMKASGAKLFIGGLSWETTTEKMLEHFKKYGEIIDSVIMKDRGTGHPRGFGFVTYSDPSVIDAVMRHTHTLDGRTVEVKRSIPRESMDLLKGPKTKKLFVGGLPTSVSEEEFKNYFKSYGSVVEAQIMQDHNTGRSRGFGFVTFDSEETVEDILTQGKTHEFDGKQVEIKKAEPKNAMQDSRSSRSGSGRGGYGVGQEDYGYGDGYGGYIGGHRSASGYGDGYGGAYVGGYGGGYSSGGFGAGYVGGYGGGSMGGYGVGSGYDPDGYGGMVYGGYSGGGYGGGYGGSRSGGRYHPYNR